MTLLRNPFILFTIFIIIIMSFSSCYSIKFLDDDHNINNLEGEFGNDFHFKAYPSNYFNTILDHEKNNNIKKNLEIISRFQRYNNMEKFNEEEDQAKVTTINVDSFGAKGDGSIDDTNVSISFLFKKKFSFELLLKTREFLMKISQTNHRILTC